MGASSSILKPQELTEFRKLNTSIENIEIPARPESRNVTDRKGFIIFGFAIIIFLPIFLYALIKSDVRRIFFGYDNCGNMCGINNPKIDDIPCSGVDYTSKPYVNTTTNKDILLERSVCLSHCPKGMEDDWFFRRCIKPLPTNDFDDDTSTADFGRNVNWGNFSVRLRRTTSDDELEKATDVSKILAQCRKEWWKFLVAIIITIVLCLFMLYLLRYTPEVLVWGILILTVLIVTVITIGLWLAYFTKDTANGEERGALLGGAVVFTVIAIAEISLFICLFKKIGLVIQLFKEATKAVFATPFIILVPVLTSVVQFVIFVVFVISTVYLSTSRQLHKYSETHYKYEMGGLSIFALVLNVMMTIWTMHFIAGIQYMTIAGSVSAWYFAKNKQYLGSPVCRGFLNSVKFHAGTIAVGSFILMLMAFVRALIRSMLSNEKLRWAVECCCSSIEAFLKFLSRNAYIETAIHGQSFLRSGRRAAKLLLANAGSVIAINSVGDFVLGMIVFLTIVISTGISAALFLNLKEGLWVPTLICFLVNVVIVVMIFEVFSTAIETLFICFCEDSVINDGISRPYFMSRGLMEFIESSKRVYGNN